jgi:hypothetical protein
MQVGQSNESTDSLAAVHGSPTEINYCFPLSPPFHTRDSLMVAKCHEARVRCPPISDTPASSAKPATILLLVKLFLIVPYIVFVGFLPFLAPAHLSRVVFSPLVGYATRPFRPMEVFAYHSERLPWHVGTSLGFLFVAVWSLGKSYPGFAISLLALLVGRTMWVWGNFDPKPGAGEAKLGIDDRATIFWLLRGFVLGDLIYSMDDFSKWRTEQEEIDDGEEDCEMETLEREIIPGKAVDFVIRLKDRPHECLRITVDRAESL